MTLANPMLPWQHDSQRVFIEKKETLKNFVVKFLIMLVECLKIDRRGFANKLV